MGTPTRPAAEMTSPEMTAGNDTARVVAVTDTGSAGEFEAFGDGVGERQFSLRNQDLFWMASTRLRTSTR
jgi:hypothetical protein